MNSGVWMSVAPDPQVGSCERRLFFDLGRNGSVGNNTPASRALPGLVHARAADRLTVRGVSAARSRRLARLTR